MNDYLSRLIAHMRWADRTVADALQDHPDPEAVRAFAHIASVEHVWYSRIHARTPTHAIWPELSVSQSRAVAEEHADRFDELLREADDDALARVIHYRNSAGHAYENAVSDIVIHTAIHGEHHRGQIARFLRAAGREPPYTDYIQYTRRDQ